MIPKVFSEKMPKLSDMYMSLSFIVLSVIVMVLFLACIYSGSNVYDSYKEMQENKSRITQMESYISDWLEKSEMVNSSPMHPVKKEELDSVQTSMLLALKRYNLNLTGFRTEQAAPNTDSHKHDYEISFDGKYSDVASFLNQLQNNSFLLSVVNLKMQQQKGLVKVTMKYRIYSK